MSPRRSLALAVGLVLYTVSCLAAALDTVGVPAPAPAPAHQSLELIRELGARANPDLAGYLSAVFLGSDPYIYFYLSNGNNPVSFRALNKGAPVLRPTKGTGGVRDPALVQGGGDDAGRKWYIVGTDLDIGKVCGLVFSYGPPLRTLDFTLTFEADELGRLREDGLARHLRVGKHRPCQLGQREARRRGRQHGRHGVGSGSDMGSCEEYALSLGE